MNHPRSYSTAAAFRVALEERLNRAARNEGVDPMRLRRQFAFDRLLCRIFADDQGTVVLKGGYAMELRLAQARTTKDIDLCLKSSSLPNGSSGTLHAWISERAAVSTRDRGRATGP